MKCVKCSKEASFDMLCEACYVEDYEIVESFKKFDLKLCALCGAYMYGKAWRPPLEVAKALRKSLYDTTSFNDKPDSFEIEYRIPKHEQKKGTKVKFKISIDVTKKIGNSIKEEEFEIPMKIRYTVCDTCARNKSGYFEGILQLRGSDTTNFKEAVAFIQRRVAGRKGVEITKEGKVKNGYDFYITSKAYMPTLAKNVSHEYGGEVKTSSQLFSHDKQTSKDIYRINTLIRLPEFAKNDVIEINNKLLLVKRLREKNVYGIDLKTNKDTREDYINNKYFIIKKAADAIKVEIIRRRPFLEVLHPETFQPVEIQNPQETKRGKIKVVVIEERVYMTDN